LSSFIAGGCVQLCPSLHRDVVQSDYLKRVEEEAQQRAEAEAIAAAEREKEEAAREAELKAETDRRQAAERLAEELRRLEADVATLPPLPPRKPGVNGKSRAPHDGKKRSSDGKPVVAVQPPSAEPVPLVKEKQKLYAKADQIGRSGLLFPFMTSWSCSHAEATRHSASIRAGVLEGDEWLERRCVAAIIRRVRPLCFETSSSVTGRALCLQACDALHLESVVIARSLLLAVRFYESYPVRTEAGRIDAVAACAVLLAQKSEVRRIVALIFPVLFSPRSPVPSPFARVWQILYVQ
jgi:hypothetical protein